jgi:hypothetical protein
VSRSWVEHWRVVLAPDAVGLARWPLVGREPAATWSRPCEAADGAGRPWQPALRELAFLLDEAGAQWSLASVVISNHWARFLVLPWQPEVAGADELNEVARRRLQQIHGTAVDGWAVRCSEGGFGRPTLVCAFDQALIDAIDETLRPRRLRSASIQPLLALAFNSARRGLPADAAFALIEPGRICVAATVEGAIAGIASRRVVTDDGAAVAENVDQELAAMGLPSLPDTVDLLRVGEVAPWPADAARPARAVGGEGAQGSDRLWVGVP